MSRKHFLGTILFLLTAWVVQAQETERQYLSGTGLGNTVTWQFRVSEGNNSGRWSKIEVPSQWELQGFGEYTYGRWYKKPGVKNPSMEEGTYKRSFRVPRDWQGQNVRLWFGGVMTDTEVFVNGQSAGPVHQGGFYRFSYDVTDLLKFGSGLVALWWNISSRMAGSKAGYAYRTPRRRCPCGWRAKSRSTFARHHWRRKSFYGSGTDICQRCRTPSRESY